MNIPKYIPALVIKRMTHQEEPASEDGQHLNKTKRAASSQRSTPPDMATALNTQNDNVKRSDSLELSVAGQKVPLDRLSLSESQPRRYFDKLALQQLTDSVKEHGILQPILVRPVGEKYEVVAGERRYRAAVAAGLLEVPVTIREMSDSQAVQCALVENLQREDLNPVEETEGILELLALNLNVDRESVISLLNQMANVKRGFTDSAVRSEEQQSVEEVFATIGRLSPESFRTHRLPLLNLPPEILEALRLGRIEYTKAKEIAKLEPESERMALLSEAISQSLTLRQVQKLVRAKKAPSQPVELQAEMENISKIVKKFKAWGNPDKRSQLEALLAQMEALLSEEE
ncbi:ParB/RepB/Spo0J family partition protein [Kamptonema formosum]|uniref:ParB/RepB/Spo0J family partition protein n=1 Tax=Kamptonema formosum TaxID=331992 RepID=UPI0003463BAD|nr:ParB/RepB/Spo0J family partition protein [Oscillatoria sp. PCC 10802]